ncbi:hypothetical protein J5274_22865 [Rhizobium sp. L51/94]|nr:hypothetical protein J5274_22865 [Rhizobium sp. L51/94]
MIKIAQQAGIPLAEIRHALSSLPNGRTPNAEDRKNLAGLWRPVSLMKNGSIAYLLPNLSIGWTYALYVPIIGNSPSSPSLTAPICAITGSGSWAAHQNRRCDPSKQRNSQSNMIAVFIRHRFSALTSASHYEKDNCTFGYRTSLPIAFPMNPPDLQIHCGANAAEGCPRD